MRASRLSVIAARLLLATSLSAQGPAPPQQPTFRSGTTLVEVSAIVTKDREPITDLKVEEVTVLDNGVPQPIVAFEYVDLSTDAGVRHRRDFVLVLDDLSIAQTYTMAAIEVANTLIDALWPADRLAVVNTGPFSLVEQLSTDRLAARKLVRQFRGQKGMSPQSFQGSQICHNTVVALRVIENAMDVMAREPIERRAILVVSEGHRLYWLEGGSKGTERCDEARTTYERMLRASAFANIAVYGVDVRGLQAQAPNFSGAGGPAAAAQAASGVVAASSQARVDTLYGSLGMMALATGGTLTAERNNLAAGVDEMIRDSRRYYRIVYVQPEVSRRERNKTRGIEVQVRRPAADVRARQRYLPR